MEKKHQRPPDNVSTDCLYNQFQNVLTVTVGCCRSVRHFWSWSVNKTEIFINESLTWQISVGFSAEKINVYFLNYGCSRGKKLWRDRHFHDNRIKHFYWSHRLCLWWDQHYLNSNVRKYRHYHTVTVTDELRRLVQWSSNNINLISSSDVTECLDF